MTLLAPFPAKATGVVCFALSLALCGWIKFDPKAASAIHLPLALTILILVGFYMACLVARAKGAAEHTVDSFFSVSNSLLCVLGYDGNARRLNRAWEKLLGVPLNTLQSQPLFTLIHPDDSAATGETLCHIASGDHVTSFENRMRCADGSYRWLAWNATAVPGERSFFCTVKDITERKQEQISDQTAHLCLLRSNDDLERFAFMASHDLQEPLRMVASFAQQLEKHYKGRLDDRADRYINYVVDGALRMQNLIGSLLSYARLEQSTPVFANIPTESSLRNAIHNLQSAIQESSADITFAPLPVLHADASLLTHLFQNLLANSIKFHGSQPPKIHISAERQGPDWIFQVEDHGLGVPANESERIFGLFQRLHSKSEYPGSGMGLAICQKILEYHGGRIWTDPSAVSGARFLFSLKYQMDPLP